MAGNGRGLLGSMKKAATIGLISSILVLIPQKAYSKFLEGYFGHTDIFGSYEQSLSNDVNSGKISLENELYQKIDDKGKEEMWKRGFFSTNYKWNNKQESSFDADLNIINVGLSLNKIFSYLTSLIILKGFMETETIIAFLLYFL